MLTTAVFAFLHHLAAFTMAGALIAELALFERNPTVAQARKQQRADMLYGISAGAVLIVGLLRVFFFEKGGAYYFANAAFIAKLSLFVLVGLASIYPTVVFLSWGKQLKSNRPPQLSDLQADRVRSILVLELAGIAAILLCAALMARGIGQLG
jgi:putative membrane protein